MILLKAQLGRLLDGDDTLVARDAAGETVEQGRFPAAGAAGDQQVGARPDARLEKPGGFHGERAEADQVSELVGRGGKPANGEHRPIDRNRGQHHRHPGAVRQAGLEHGIAGLKAPADTRDQGVDRGQKLVFVGKSPVGQQDPAFPLNVDGVGSVDHDLGQARIPQKVADRLELG